MSLMPIFSPVVGNVEPPYWVSTGTFASGQGVIEPGLPAGGTVDDFYFLVNECRSDQDVRTCYWSKDYVGQMTEKTNVTNGSRAQLWYEHFLTGHGVQDHRLSDSGNHTSARAILVRNCDTTDPFDGTPTTNTYASSLTTTFTAADFTTTVKGCLLYTLVTVADDRPLSSWDLGTEVFSNSHTAGNDGSLFLSVRDAPDIGTYSGDTITLSASANNFTSITFALRPPQ